MAVKTNCYPTVLLACSGTLINYLNTCHLINLLGLRFAHMTMCDAKIGFSLDLYIFLKAHVLLNQLLNDMFHTLIIV